MTRPLRNLYQNEWEKVRVGAALRLINGRAFKPSEWREDGLPIVRIQNLNDPEAPFNYYDGELPEKFRLNDGDLLFAWSGTPGTSFGAHIWRRGKAWLNQHIFKVLFDENMFDRRFLRLAINQNLNDYIRAAHGGAGLAHITKGKFEESELVKPPLDVQREIVAEIEKQFSRLDEAVANLKRVKANLKRYKAAVLKAAVEGKLTEEWRKAHPDVERASELLKRILAERRAKWNGKGKYKEPAFPLTVNPSDLPKDWTFATLDQLSILITDGDHNPPERVVVGVPHLTAKNIRDWQLDFQDCTFISREDAERVFKRYRPSAGDLIITCVGTVGRTAIVPEAVIFSPDRNLAALRTVMQGVLTKYLQCLLNSPGIQQSLRGASGATAQPHLYLRDLRQITVRLPPIAEQGRIVVEIERRFSVIDKLNIVLVNNLRRAERQRQAILKCAFEGQLTN